MLAPFSKDIVRVGKMASKFPCIPIHPRYLKDEVLRWIPTSESFASSGAFSRPPRPYQPQTEPPPVLIPLTLCADLQHPISDPIHGKNTLDLLFVARGDNFSTSEFLSNLFKVNPTQICQLNELGNDRIGRILVTNSCEIAALAQNPSLSHSRREFSVVLDEPAN